MLDVSDIKLIRTVAEVGSINKAAEILHTSQPTLSKRIARLEQMINIALFYRSSNGMLATEAAKYIIASGDALNSKLGSMQRTIDLMAAGETGSINIGVGPIIEQLFLPKLILDFTEETKNIKVTLRTGDEETLLKLFNSGALDIAIGPFDFDNFEDGLIIKPFMQSKIIPVARKGHPIFKIGPVVPASEILNYPSIAPTIPNHIAKRVKHLDLGDLPLITCDNYFTTKSVVLSSDYISAGPALVFRQELESGLLKAIPVAQKMLWKSFCITRPETMLSPTVSKFIDIVSRYSKACLTEANNESDINFEDF